MCSVSDWDKMSCFSFSVGKGRNILPWPTRMKIALGAARGLAYLHEDCNTLQDDITHIISCLTSSACRLSFWCYPVGHPRIIHRDIKTSNILLDKNFNAQVKCPCSWSLMFTIPFIISKLRKTYVSGVRFWSCKIVRRQHLPCDNCHRWNVWVFGTRYVHVSLY